MDEGIQYFLVEGNEQLATYEMNLLKLESDPENKSIIQEIFRSIHSIKGTCGFLGLVKLQEISHAGENLLSALRDGKIRVSSHLVSTLLELSNVIKEIMAHIAKTETEGDKDYTGFIDNLNKSLKFELLDSGNIPQPTQQITTNSESTISDTEITQTTIRVDIKLLDQLMNLVGELVLNRNQILQTTSKIQNTHLQDNTAKLNQLTTELQVSANTGIEKIKVRK